MSTLKVNNLQVGQDATASNNFTLYQPAVPDGTVRLGVGNSGSVTDALILRNNSELILGTTSTGGALRVYGSSGRLIVGDTGVNYYDASSHNFRDYSSFASRLYIKSDGNVGIGTDNPPVKLSVAVADGEAFRLQNLDSSIGGGESLTFALEYPNALGSSTGWRHLSRYAGSRYQLASNIDNAGYNVKLSITEDGNVGIGTDNPISKIHVYNASGDYLEYGGNPRLFLQTPSGLNGLRIYSTTTPFEAGGSSSTRRVTIGSDPNYDISVSGKYSGTANDSSPRLFFNATYYNGSSNLTAFQGTIHSVSTSNASNAGYLGLGADANGNHLVIEAGTGDIGIGTTSPNFKLHIKGGSNGQLAVEGGEADIWMKSTGSNKDWRILGSTGGSTHRFRVYDSSAAADRFNIYEDGEVVANNGYSYLQSFRFTFNLNDGEEEILFYNPDGYRRILYEVNIQSAHGSNGYGYMLFNMSRYGIDYHLVDWNVAYTSYGFAGSVNGNANNSGIKFTRPQNYGVITYYVQVKCYSAAGGNPVSYSGLTDASYLNFTRGF